MSASGFRPGTLRCAIGFAAALRVLPGLASAQGAAEPATPGSGAPATTATRASDAPVLDGVLDDPAWQSAPSATGFSQVQPEDGQPASERTEVRILFTDDTLYVGVICHDRSPAGIIVADARRDSSLTETDSFTMVFDTYRDRQNGFVFGTNPAGIEYDGQVTNEGQGGGGLALGQMQTSGAGGGFNINWDGAWEVRARITERGWEAEFAIPFRTLRFPAGAEQVWGVNFQRNIRRHNERAYWAPIPRQYDLYKVSLAGTVSGLRVPSLRNLKVTPYVLGNALASGPAPADGDLFGDVGGDVKYAVTPSLALDGTINTDFAQVEVDDQQVNLDRFNLFFPEKRPFFLENAGFFTVGNPGEVELFFSRRIGLAGNGEQIPILWGSRLSGKAGGFNLGLLDMQADDYETAPSNNFAVVRVSRDLPNRSSVGGLFVNRSGFGEVAREDDHNQTYAVDGKLGVGRNTQLTSFLARTATPGEGEGREYAWNVRSRTNLPRIDLEFGYQEVGEAFNPEVGFLSRAGYRKPDARIMTRFRPKDFWSLQELRPHVSYRGFWGFDGFQETGFTHIDNHWQFRNAYEVHTGVNLTHEGVRTPFVIYPGVAVTPGTYRNAEAQLVFMTNQGAPLSLNVQAVIGGFFGGDRVSLSPTVRGRVGDRLTSELAYVRNDVDLPEGAFVTNLARLRVSYAFTTRSFLQGLVQYNDRADLWSMNFRFGWLQAANTGLFVVYTDTRYLYDLIPQPQRTDRSLVVKYSRMFDVLQ
jgi:hypothetical protein